ncbi:threonine--tRNA ligase [candidate division KSB1 bacterium]|nr:threonine--tRNA ligase [candidate division KSB1 bacterium]
MVVKIQGAGEKQVETGSTAFEAIQAISPKLQKFAVAIEHDGQLMDLGVKLTGDTQFRVLTTRDPEGMAVFWHSSSHVMAQAVQALYPDAKLAIGPSIENGFYYDFLLDTPIAVDDLSRIEEKMQEIVAQSQAFSRKEISNSEALKLFSDRKEHFKVELIKELSEDSISIYENGTFVDLCRGPHLPSSGYVNYFKLLSVAGSYWRGDERNAVLQRIYGISFPKKSQLDAYLTQLEEAKKRDHRKLGKELDLFSFQAEGPGFPFWHPNGVILYNEVQQYMQETLDKHDYKGIKTPIILNEALWHLSGHWDNYKENMYFTSIDKQPYAVKPMNCPGGLLVYKNAMHSYRELPIKLSEMGLVHRHEKSGVLHGLFRVRMFTQDDAHVYCTPDQLEDEIVKIIDLISEVYHAFGFENIMIELSTRPVKSIGSAEMWNRAETALQHALENKKISFQVNEGEGAFYGPKIDYHVKDSLNRQWQCGTIQVDFSMPERFELEYIGPDGEKHRPVMIHRAILGSVERFIGILIEHYGGALPIWLAPIQTIVLPISEKHHSEASVIYRKMKACGIRCHLDDRNEKVGYKIREAETQKIPYMCIIGDREITEKSVSVRKRREGDLGSMILEDFIERVQGEIQRRDCH